MEEKDKINNEEDKSKLNINDIKINFKFSLEDINGEQVKVQNGMIFKSALEPGVVTSVAKRVESTLSAIGEDYFLLLFRDYLNAKMNDIYKIQLLSNQPNQRAITDDTKYVAESVTEVLAENVKTDAEISAENEGLDVKPNLEIE